MGLDSYLRRKAYVKCWKSDDNGVKDATKVDILVRVTYPDGTSDSADYSVANPESGVDISMPVAYWRKANAIHRWFIQNCANGQDGCREMSVSVEQLMELRRLCEQVLEDHSKAPELLPTQDGFFFGSTEYDESYFWDLKHTVEALSNLDEGYWYEYQASW